MTCQSTITAFLKKKSAKEIIFYLRRLVVHITGTIEQQNMGSHCALQNRCLRTINTDSSKTL